MLVQGRLPIIAVFVPSSYSKRPTNLVYAVPSSQVVSHISLLVLSQSIAVVSLAPTIGLEADLWILPIHNVTSHLAHSCHL